MQELAAEGDRSGLYDVARALLRLQAYFGGARIVKGVGAAASAVRSLLTRMRQELGAEGPIIGGPFWPISLQSNWSGAQESSLC